MILAFLLKERPLFEDVELSCDAAPSSDTGNGILTVKVVPFPGTLFKEIFPFIRVASCLVMVSPSPVPPYFRVVEESDCWNLLKIISCRSEGKRWSQKIGHVAKVEF